MNIVEKIKASIIRYCDIEVIYDDATIVNIRADNINTITAIIYLLKSAQQSNLNGQIVESADIAVFFIQPTTFDFGGIENERLIQDCRQLCNKWLKGLRTDYHLNATNPTATQRVYDEFDQVVTGFAVNLSVTEMYGFNFCVDANYLPPRTLTVIANGVYDIYGYTDLIVNCPQQSIVAYADIYAQLHIDGLTIYDNDIVIPSHDSEIVPRGTIKTETPTHGVKEYQDNGTYELDGTYVWANVEVGTDKDIYQQGEDLHLPSLQVDEFNNIIIDLRNGKI